MRDEVHEQQTSEIDINSKATKLSRHQLNQSQ